MERVHKTKMDLKIKNGFKKITGFMDKEIFTILSEPNLNSQFLNITRLLKKHFYSFSLYFVFLIFFF